MADDLKAQIGVELDATGVQAGAQEAIQSVEKIGDAVQQTAQITAAAMDKVDDSFKKASTSMSREEKTFAQAITRATNDYVRLNAQLEAGAKNTAAFFTAQAEARGLDPQKFAVQIDLLEKQNELYKAQKFQVDEATAALQENWAIQKRIQEQQKQKDTFVDNLRKQAETLGLTSTELLRYQAGLVGAEKEAAQYIDQINRTNAVIAEQADQLKLLNQARQQQAANQQAGASYLASLRDELQQVLLTKDAYKLWRAEQLGVAKDAGVLIEQTNRANAVIAEQADQLKLLNLARQQQAQQQASQIKEREAFIASLKREAEAIGKTRAELLAKRAAELGVTQETAGFIKAIGDADTRVTKLGDSARATNAILRQVPAQFTDIVVSLASGQQPLTVFLQQGGQLKDMFGSVGEAARAMGGYLLGLINPLNIAALTVGAMAVAFYQGSKEAGEFNKALILTGNQVGTTVSGLATMRASLESTGATQGRAAEALLAFVNTAKVGRENLEEFTAAALRFERAGGSAAEEVAKQFAELAKEPLNASMKLNEAIGFLSFSTAEQIRLLEEQGRQTEAANVAQKAYAEYLNNVTPQLEANLGLIERGWNAVKDAVKGAWDQLLNLGRNDTADKLKSTLADIARFEGQIARGLGSLVDKDELERLRAAAASYQALIQFDKNLADQRTATAREEDARTRARKAFFDEEKQYLDKKEQRLKEIASVEAKAAQGAITDAEAANRIDAINKKYEEREKVSRRVSAATRDETTNLNKLVGLNTDYVQSLKDLVTARDKGNIGQEQYVSLVTALIEKQPFAIKLAKEQADVEKEIAKNRKYLADERDKYFDAIGKDIAAIEKQIAAVEKERDALTMTREELAKVTAARRDEEIAMVKAEMTRLSMLPGMDAELAKLKEKYDALIRLRDAELGLAGAKDAKQFSDAVGKELSKQAKDAQKEWERASDQIERALTDSLMRGFESGKGFAENLRDSVTSMFKTMVLKPMVSAVVNPVAGAVTSAFMGSATNAAGSSILSSLGMSGLAAQGGFAGLGSAFVTGGSLTAAEAAAAASAYSAAGMGGTATALNLGSALGPIAAYAPYIIAAAVAINALIGEGGGPKSGGQYISQVSGGIGSVSSLQTSLATDGGRVLYTPSTADADIQKMIGSVVSSVVASATKFGGRAGDFTVGLGYDIDPEGDASNRISSFLSTELGDILRNVNIDLGRDEAALKQGLGLEISRLVAAGLSASQLPQQIARIFDSIDIAAASQEQIDALFAAANAMDTLLEAAAELDIPIWRISEAMIAAAGGTEQFTANLAGYYQNFYTEQERTQRATQELKNEFAVLGFAMPKTREGFRALIEGIEDQLAEGLGDENFEATLGTLLGLQDEFAALVPATKDAEEAVAELAETLTGMGLADLFDLVGLTEQAKAERTRVIGEAFTSAGLSGIPTSLSDFQTMVLDATPEQRAVIGEFANDIVDMLTVLEDGSEVIEDVAITLEEALTNLRNPTRTPEQIAQSIVSLESTGARLGVDLLRAQGRGTEADVLTRTLDIAGMTKAEVTLYDYNEAIRDQISALNEARAEQERVATERKGLDRQLLELQGDTAALRKLERDSISESNRDLYDRITALKDSKEAEQKATTILNERQGLERQVLELQGDTVALRNLERDALDESNRALYDKIEALKASKVAEEEAKQVAAERVALDDRLNAALGNSVSARERERAAIDATNLATYDRIIFLEDLGRKTTLFDAFGLKAEANSNRLLVLNEALGRVGLTLPATKEALLEIVNAATPTQASVLLTFADLLKTVVGGFEEAVPVIEEVAAKISQADLANLYTRIGAPDQAKEIRANLAKTALAAVGISELPIDIEGLRTLVATATDEQRQVIYGSLDDIFATFGEATQEAARLVGFDLANLYEKVGLGDLAKSVRLDTVTAAFGKLGLVVPTTEAGLRDLVSTLDGAQAAAVLPFIDAIVSLVATTQEATTELAKLDAVGIANLYQQVGLKDEAAELFKTIITDAFAEVNLVLPTTTAELQALVRAASPEQAAVIAKYAGELVSLTTVAEDAATGFGSLEEALEALRKGTARTYEQIATSILSMQATGAQLQVDLLSATGQTAEARAAQRTLDITGMTPEEIAVYDANQLLKDQIAAANQAAADAAEAARLAAERAAEQQRAVEQQAAEARARSSAIAEERTALENQILQLQGNTVELRRRELEQLDPSNRALQERIWALEREKAITSEREGLERQLLDLQGDTAALRALEREALDESNRGLYDQIQALRDRQTAEQELAQQQAAIANERAGLERRLLELTGDTEALRQLELDALDPSNRALQEHIWALEDEQEAAQSAAQAAEDLRNSWKGVAQTLNDEVEAILSGMGNDQQSYAELQAKFAVATAQARSGDIKAAEKLTDLSRALIEAGTAQADSQLEVARIRATIADSLRATSAMTEVFGQTPEEVAGLPSRVDWVDPATDPAKLVSTLESLQGDQQAQSYAIAALNARMVKIVERWDTDGLPQTRIEA